jgi:hypothetical protein
MAFFARHSYLRRTMILVSGFAMILLAKCLKAAPPEPEEFNESAGLVWFIGTVEQVVDGVSTIDLGEVHTLRNGSTVAAVRYRDSHFTPLGVLEVRFSHPTWCQMEKSGKFTSEVGDLVMFVEAPGDMGSGDAIRDAFIRHRIVANANRNRYSTMRDSSEANTLQDIVDNQRNWIEENSRIAGIVRSPTVTRNTLNRLRFFINQIMAFQDYQDQGVNVAQATSESWSEILRELRHRLDSAESESPEIGADSPENAITTEDNVGTDRSLAVKHQVDESMLQRSPEERNIVAVICTKLLQTKTTNERQWMSLQLDKCQFPFLSAQEQVLIDMESIMRRVRKTE